MTPRARKGIFVLACLTAIALPVLYVTFATRTPPALSPSTAGLSRLALLEPGRRGMLFRSTVPDATFGRVAYVSFEGGDTKWQLTDIECDRVYFQRGRGVCEVIDSNLVPPYAFFVFDQQFRPASRRPLSGVPSRARVSPDGRRAALTVFESGHSYAEGGFSTRTTVLDASTGDMIGDLEQFAVTRDGMPFKSVDFNFWGLTFAADSNQFFATLRSNKVNYLIEGSIDQRTARVIHSGVECPSLSPDGRRLAFKKRVSDNMTVFWQVAVLDLATKQERVLDWETRSVDDQVDWLDDNQVVYHLAKSGGADIWALRTDRPEPPRILVEGGYSPSVVR